MVSTVCFKDNTPPCQNIISHLLSFLMVEVPAVAILRGMLEQLFMFVWVFVWVYVQVCGILIMCFFSCLGRQILTKALSPFDDSVDKNPVVRSVVLKLLLKYR